MSPILPGIVASGISGHLYTPEGSAYEIASYVVPAGSTVAAVTFSVPQDYRHFRIEGASFTTGATNPTWTVNGDTDSTKYFGHHLWGTGAAVAANNQSGTVYWNYNPSSSYPASFVMDWFEYTSTTKTKVMRTLAGSDTNGGTREVAYWTGLYTNKVPITSITLNAFSGTSFSEQSTFTLIGYK